MTKRWFINALPTQEEITNLSQQLNINEVLATILLQRGINTFDEAQLFFRPKLEHLHNPLLMKNMGLAVNRIQQALEQGEKILLFGDYDVDGTTSVALLWSVMKSFYENLDFYIPDRYAEGYGISFQGINYAEQIGASLIIALDCGIKAHDKVLYATEKGIDFIICDHHEPGETVPKAIVLDPKQTDCNYPYKELAGCGVGFKLLQALFQQYEWDTKILFENLDLVAISIAADLVPITGENRILAHYGLQLLNKRPRPGIQEILIKAKKDLPLTLTNVVFIIAPRINAAGRIHEGKKAVQLLISEERNELRTLADSIERDNIERRKLDQEITQHALDLLVDDEDFQNKITTVVYHDSWHKGVIGIVASRLIESHYKPTIVLTESNGKITGSARSIRGLNIHDALEKCTDFLEQFGGHAYAAGMTMLPEQLEAFKQRFEEVVQQNILQEDLVPIQHVDYELAFKDIFEDNENRFLIPKFKRILDQLEPHGPGNMKPVFVSKNVYVEDVRVLKDEHLKLSLTQPHTGIVINAIAFGLADKIDLVLSKEPLDILYTLETNVWNQQETLQLNVKDIRLNSF